MAKRTTHLVAGQLSLREVNRATLARQMLLARESADVVGAVERLAGMQAQYSPSPYIGLWTRLHEFRIEELESALHNKQVVKASLMRWTLHLASAHDYPFFSRAITESRAAAWRPNAEKAGLHGERAPEILHARLLEFASRPRLLSEMQEFLHRHVPPQPHHHPSTAWHAASALGWLVHVPPSGTWKYFGKNRYISAREWLGQTEEPPLEESIVHLVSRYLSAFGPATRADIASWAGLRKLSYVDDALRALGGDVIAFAGEQGETLYDLAAAPRPGADATAPPRFLPKWDNVLLAYQDRERVLPAQYRKVVIAKNGDVLPTILVDGRVAGAWSVRMERQAAILAIETFAGLDPATHQAVQEEAEDLVRFMEPEAATYEVRVTGLEAS